MNLRAFDIPEDSGELAPWLERQMVGLDLGSLVAELAAVHRASPGSSNTVREFLGPDVLRHVMERGLGVLSPEQLQQLLVHPAWLLDLQELVLFAGGPYWTERSREAAELEPVVRRSGQRLAAYLQEDLPTPATHSRPRLLAPRLRWYQRPLVVALASAAVVLLGVVLVENYYRTPAPAEIAWGWARPGALPEGTSAPQYLEGLADSAEQWFNKRPEDAPALAQRMSEFRRGCSVLILSPHSPLAPADRTWLVEKCRLWATRFDKHLADIEAGRDPVEVRGEMDETVNKLVTALRTRAREAVPADRT